MWDFTHMYIPNNLPLMCESLPFYGFWLSPTHSPLPMSFFHHLHIIYGPFICPPMVTICQPHTLIHENRPAHSCHHKPFMLHPMETTSQLSMLIHEIQTTHSCLLELHASLWSSIVDDTSFMGPFLLTIWLPEILCWATCWNTRLPLGASHLYTFTSERNCPYIGI